MSAHHRFLRETDMRNMVTMFELGNSPRVIARYYRLRRGTVLDLIRRAYA